jgi:hypothetical protein
LLSRRSFPARTFGSVSTFVLFWFTVMPTLVRGYLFTHYTPEILLNPVFEDLRMPKVPNRPLQYALVAHTFPSFQRLLDKALDIKHKRVQLGDLKRKAITQGHGSSSVRPRYVPP